MDRFFVVTGGPGSGKSTLLAAALLNLKSLEKLGALRKRLEKPGAKTEGWVIISTREICPGKLHNLCEIRILQGRGYCVPHLPYKIHTFQQKIIF